MGVSGAGSSHARAVSDMYFVEIMGLRDYPEERFERRPQWNMRYGVNHAIEALEVAVKAVDAAAGTTIATDKGDAMRGQTTIGTGLKEHTSRVEIARAGLDVIDDAAFAMHQALVVDSRTLQDLTPETMKQLDGYQNAVGEAADRAHELRDRIDDDGVYVAAEAAEVQEVLDDLVKLDAKMTKAYQAALDRLADA